MTENKICAWCYYARMRDDICGIYCTGGFTNSEGTCDHFRDSSAMNDNKTPECADLVAALRTAANGGLILTGKAAGVTVNPQCLEYAADLLEQLISLQTENAELKQRVEAKEAILRLYEPTLSLVASDKDTAIHRMRKAEAALSRVEAERDAAKKCIYDIETYLAFGSVQYIDRTIQAWQSGAQGEG